MSGNSDILFRMGEARDAMDIAHYFNMANNGLSEVWWKNTAKEGENWQQAFAADILDEHSIAYHSRCVLAEADGKIVGLLISFPQEELPSMEEMQAEGLPSSELNLLELRKLAQGSLYIAVTAVHADYRGRGIARHFVNLSMSVAESSNFKEVFGIIHESNRDWLAHFLRRGFTEKGRRTVGDHKSYPHGSEWILVTAPVQKNESNDQERAS